MSPVNDTVLLSIAAVSDRLSQNKRVLCAIACALRRRDCRPEPTPIGPPWTMDSFLASSPATCFVSTSPSVRSVSRFAGCATDTTKNNEFKTRMLSDCTRRATTPRARHRWPAHGSPNTDRAVFADGASRGDDAWWRGLACECDAVAPHTGGRRSHTRGGATGMCRGHTRSSADPTEAGGSPDLCDV